jgi:hypothetical protein
MKYLNSFNDFESLNEKSIGSENIRLKWYYDIPKDIFYKLVNTDPTSVRKKDFSKPGKYTKWLIREYKSRSFNLLGQYDNLNDIEDFDFKKLNYYLFVFSTGWFKQKMKSESKDILTYTYDKFESMMSECVESYELETSKSKFDIVYSDDKINVLIPLNFSASYELAKNTDWCTKTIGSFSKYKRYAVMFRVVPNDKTYDIIKITWNKKDGWCIACSKYPELCGNDNSPFDIIDGKENWYNIKCGMDMSVYTSKEWLENSKKIEDTMELLSNNAKKLIEEYYSKNR